MRDYEILEKTFEFAPSHRGTLSGDEVQALSTILEVSGKTETELRELRNYMVRSYSVIAEYLRFEKSKEYMNMLDKSSAICGVIDHALYSMGAPV